MEKTRSEWEIERWTGIIERNRAGGLERLSRYICSLCLGRDFGEDSASYFERRGLAEFVAWTREVQS